MKINYNCIIQRQKQKGKNAKNKNNHYKNSRDYLQRFSETGSS